MINTPLAISKLALLVSAAAFLVALISLIFSLINKWAEKRLHFEQLRGEIRSKLTAWGIDAGQIFRKVVQSSSPQALEIGEKLEKFMSGVVDIRSKLEGLSYPFVVELQAVLSDIKDMEPVFNRLLVVVNNADWKEVNIILDGLLVRLYGSKSKNK